MSQSESMIVLPKHYQAICGLALIVIFMIQVQQNIMMLINVCLLFIGSVFLLFRVRFSPLIVFLAIASGQILDQRQENLFFGPDFRSLRFLDVSDVLLCLATLTYIAGAYRLHGLRFNVFPYDERQEREVRVDKPGPVPSPQARSEQSLTPTEFTWLLIPIPVFVLAAECFALLLKQHWDLVGLPPRWRQFLVIAWLFLIVTFVAAHVFRYWRRLQMDRGTAQLLLQDLLWHETRGEQRRLSRWMVWRKLSAPSRNRRLMKTGTHSARCADLIE